MLVDSHCHLDLLPPDLLLDILRRAADAGVTELVSIGTGLAQSERLLQLIGTLPKIAPKIWCCLGVHPDHAGEEGLPTADQLAALLDHDNVIGLGETGLDYFHKAVPAQTQQESFRAHIRAARHAGVPVAIHARSADDDIARILMEERQDGPFDFLLHCFSSGPKLAEQALAMGGYLSFSGIVTFPKATEVQQVARSAPIDRILVETDAPYLAPVPHRGQRNEPGYVAHTARHVAGLRDMDAAGFIDRTTENFHRLFTRARVAQTVA